MNLRSIIVDDEPLAVKRLQLALSAIEGIELVGIASNGIKALDLISSTSPDLILLDIKMPIMDGFDLLRTFATQHVPEIIFVTAYSEFAVRAFEVGALGYVLKPIDEQQLRIAVDRARVKLRTRNAESRLADLTALVDELQQRKELPNDAFERELWIGSPGRMERVAVADVDWFEAAGDYVAVHSGEREHLLHDSLRSLVERLSPDEFARVHRRAIVRFQAIETLERGKLGTLVISTRSGGRVPVSRTYKRSLLSRIKAKSTNK